jgi:hypothetical protein
MGDGQIRDLVRDALLQEPAFVDFGIRSRLGERVETVREPLRRGARSSSQSRRVW